MKMEIYLEDETVQIIHAVGISEGSERKDCVRDHARSLPWPRAKHGEGGQRTIGLVAPGEATAVLRHVYASKHNLARAASPSKRVRPGTKVRTQAGAERAHCRNRSAVSAVINSLCFSIGIYHGAAQHRRAKGSVDDATEGY